MEDNQAQPAVTSQPEAEAEMLQPGVMPQPEAYIHFKDGLVDGEGKVTRQDTREFLEDFVDRFVEWIDRQRG